MQYILTELEYRQLTEESQQKFNCSKKELQDFCTKAAKYIPVLIPWASHLPAEPWGCWLDKNQIPHCGYCDCCPSQEICPHEGKEYSQ